MKKKTNNSILDPELEKHYGGYDAKSRTKLAKIFERWAWQLRLSAKILKLETPQQLRNQQCGFSKN